MDDLRYPIGHFRPAPSYSASDRSVHIEILRELPGRLRAAVSGLDDAQLDTPYRDEGWTVRQVVHHVADSHLNSYVRCKLALTEYEPTVKPYDESAWARLPDNRMPVDVSLVLTASLHLRWVVLFESLTEKDFGKKFLHPERGPEDLATT
ncbi:MAG TPA: putative metal-dependent hydrolase, partial [Gemmataceae bacterium]|nr:putative metal-dependent hydrolase [Gemmataceae bacterium]